MRLCVASMQATQRRRTSECFECQALGDPLLSQPLDCVSNSVEELGGNLGEYIPEHSASLSWVRSHGDARAGTNSASKKIVLCVKKNTGHFYAVLLTMTSSSAMPHT